ncbi:MAG TPA: OB-fold domain-containing protein [Candidatus Binatia bacterium]|nr:OB-fold domain-containing protein [Candidatus Binatia bacterium]
MADEQFVRRTGGRDWEPYWAAARDRELRFQRCADCGLWRHPPGPMCPSCHSLRSEWAQASGRGRLLSWVVVHPPVLPAWKERTPYPVVLVQCDEGVRTMGGLLGATPADLVMDMPMIVDFAPSPDGDLVPQWRPA